MMAGPTEQLIPATSTPHAAMAVPAVSMVVPPGVRPFSPMVTWASTGRSVSERTARKAASSSLRSLKVSRQNPSTPPSSSPSTCRRKKSTASSKAVAPQGSMRMPSGPTAPTTLARPAAAARASSPPARLMASVRPSSPKPDSFTGLAPKVLVSRISAPACTYSSCTSRTISGSCRLSSS